jgi:heme/copper-type cytochrome/quinol oxidase subunit 3
MVVVRKEDATRARPQKELLFVLFLIVVFFILGEITVFGSFFLLVFVVVVIIQVFGNDIQMDGMDLRHFQLRLTLRATQNLALFDLVFIDVDLGGTFRAADHDPSSVRDSQGRRR